MVRTIVDLFAMVGNVDDYGVTITIAVDDFCYSVVVVKGCVVVLCHLLALTFGEVSAVDVVGMKCVKLFGIALRRVEMLPHNVDYRERTGCCLYFVAVTVDEVAVVGA